MVSKSTFLIPILWMLSSSISNSLPLSTNGRWIIDEKNGRRVKLHCANWPGHIDTMVPEGLDKQPLDTITSTVAAMGFNCVRLTWATFMYTRPEYGDLTLSQSFDKLNLAAAKDGIIKNNPSLVDLKVGDVHEAVINSLGNKGLMVIYDNHISRPTWCCSNDDGNGFFNQLEFNPDEWMNGLNLVATRYKENPTIVAMSMRNELRGPRENIIDWYKYMRQGATTIHTANPHVLILFGGLNYATDLSFLTVGMPFTNSLDNKLLFELHWYAWSQKDSNGDWGTKPLYETCAFYREWFNKAGGFIFKNNVPQQFPLILSEFGIDQRGGDVGASNYLTCLFTVLAENELDWAIWALHGSYYIRSGVPGTSEEYGVLDNNWSQPRNPAIFQRLNLLQKMLFDPLIAAPTYYTMFHPVTGSCAMADTKDNQVYQTLDCGQGSGWDHTGDGTSISLHGNGLCLTASGEGLPVTLTNQCADAKSLWSLITDLKFHIGVKDPNGGDLCLEWRASGTATVLVSNKCNLQSDTSQDQWFQLLPTNL